MRNSRSAVVGLASLVVLAQAGFGQTYTTIRNNGPASNRADIVIIGDGYTSADLASSYGTHAENLLSYMFSDRLNDPYPRYAGFFNVHRVNLASNQSGADNPMTGVTRDTALDSTYRWDGVTDRLLYFNTSKANTAINTALAGSGISADMRIGLVNDSTYGGAGGQWAVYAAGNSSSRAIATHEIGHSFAGLADEYEYYSGNTYTNPEPTDANITKSSTGAKWSQWLGYTDPAHPTMSAVGAYEGAAYTSYGIYRPTSNSMMRSLGVALNAPSREQVILSLYKNCVDPLDAYLANTGTLQNPGQLWVDSIDPNVINVDWYVNGVLTLDNGPETLNLASLNLAAGTYTISARAYDDILDLQNTGLDYDWVRKDASYLQQTVAWTVVVPEPTIALLLLTPAALLRRRRR